MPITFPPTVSYYRPAFRPFNNYQAVAFDHMVVSTQAAVMAIKLDPNPRDLDRVAFEPSDNSWGAPNALTVNPQGVAINGVVDTLVCDVSSPFELVYYVDALSWRVLPLKGAAGPAGPQGAPGPASFSRSYSPAFASNAYNMIPTDIGATLTVTTGSTDKTITLFDPTGLHLDGYSVTIQKIDAGTGIIVLKNVDGTDNAHLQTQADTIRLRVMGDAWFASDSRMSDVQRIIDGTTVGTYTWTKRPRMTRVRFFGIGGAGGGGSGRRGAAGTARSGGGGGACGNVIDRMYTLSNLPSSLTFTIGAAAPGGAATTTDDTTGNPGTSGGDIIVINYYRARGGSGGQGGATTAAGAAVSQTGSDRAPVQNGGASSITANSPSPGNSGGGGSGGGGGCISTGNVAFNGAAGGGGSTSAVGSPSTGSAGNAPGGNAGSGAGATYPVSRPDIECGSGGGGGGGNAAGPGGTGGDGGFPGGAGGGGGASVNGFPSGAGGTGAAARLIITEYYAR